MAVKKTIELDVNTKAGLRAMDELGLSFEEAFTEADNLSGQIGELEDALYAMAAAGQSNTKEFKELSQQVGVYKKVIIDTDMQVDALSQTTAQNLGGALGGVASGFELGAGAMGAFGTESEVVEEALLKVASAMAMAQGLQGIREASKSFKGLKAQVLGTAAATKIYSFVQKGFGKSTKIASRGLKVFRGALISTGIGAIVVGIGMLIANFDKVSGAVKNAVAKFRDMGTGMKVLLYPITLLIAAYDAVTGALQYFGLIDSEETKKAKANAQARVVETEKEGEAVGKRYDYEIQKAQAAGKDTFKLEKQKREAFRATVEEQIEAIRKLAILNKKFTTEQQDQVRELYTSIAQSRRDDELAEITQKTKQNEKFKALNKERRAEELKESNWRIENQKREQEEVDKMWLASLEKKKGLAPLGDLPDVGGMPADNMVELDAEDMKGTAMFEMKEKWRKKNEESEEGYSQRKMDMTSKSMDDAMAALNSVNDLSNMLTDLAVTKAGDNEAAAEAARKKGFERSKKIQIAMAIIQGVQGTMAAFTAGSSMGPAGVFMGPLMGALAAAGAIVNIAKIKATKYSGGGSAPSAPRSAGSVQAPSFNVVGNSSENQLASSLGERDDPVIKAFVVSEDVTTAQSLDRNKIQTATL